MTVVARARPVLRAGRNSWGLFAVGPGQAISICKIYVLELIVDLIFGIVNITGCFTPH